MINVIAGVNGAGKSSVAGSHYRSQGNDYYNPDEIAAEFMAQDSQLTKSEANGRAWAQGRQILLKSIEDRTDYTFETTLGGNTICQDLHTAIDRGCDVRIWYCGLASPELHIQRVAERVAKHGHDIPSDKIRERYIKSIHNAMGLIPRCKIFKAFDNSAPLTAGHPQPILLFSLADGLFDQEPISNMPLWAKPLAKVAIERVSPYRQVKNP